MGAMLRWDSVRGGLTEEGCGIMLGSALLWGTRKGMLGFPAVGWAMPKASGSPQLTFFPRHRILPSVRHYWPLACPRMPSASCQPRPNNSHKLDRYLLDAEQPLGRVRAVPRVCGCFWVSYELERRGEGAGPCGAYACLDQRDQHEGRGGEGQDMTPLCAEKRAGVKVMASWGTVSPDGSSGRAARLMVAWGASYDLWLSSHFCLPRSGSSQHPHEPLAERMCLGKCW